MGSFSFTPREDITGGWQHVCLYTFSTNVFVLGVQFENSSEVGVFSLLTSNYCLVPEGNQNFLSVFEGELADSIPVIQTSFAETKIIGRLCAGNSKGLLVPHTTTDSELHKLEENLPDGVVVKRIDEKLSALGNIIACNDHVALLHPEADPVSLSSLTFCFL